MEVFLSIVLKQKQFTCTNEMAALPIEFTIIMEWNVHFVTLANLIFLSQIAVLCNIRISLKLRFFADSFLFLQQKKYTFLFVFRCVNVERVQHPNTVSISFIAKKGNKGTKQRKKTNVDRAIWRKEMWKFGKKQQRQEEMGYHVIPQSGE